MRWNHAPWPPTSTSSTSSNPSMTSACSNPSFLMRRSSSGSITLAPLREGSSTDLAYEDSMSQVEFKVMQSRSASQNGSSSSRCEIYLSLRIGGRPSQSRRFCHFRELSLKISTFRELKFPICGRSKPSSFFGDW